MLPRNNRKIHSAFHIVIVLTVFGLVSACGQPDPAKVVSRDGKNGQGKDDQKLTQKTGIGIPSFATLGFISFKQVSRALSIVLEGDKSKTLASCQKVSKPVPTGDPKVDLIQVTNTGCSGWSATDETFTVTYDSERTSETKKIVQIIKSRNTKSPMILTGKNGHTEFHTTFNESIKITRTADNVYDFEYNPETPQGEFESIIDRQRVNVPHPEVNLKGDEFQQNESQASSEDLQKINEQMGRFNQRNLISDQNSDDDRLGRRSRDNGRSNGRRSDTRGDRNYKSLLHLYAKGSVNASNKNWVWSFNYILVFFSHQNQLTPISYSELSILPAPDGNSYVLTPCGMPIGSMIAQKETVNLSSGNAKGPYENILVGSSIEGNIGIPGYMNNLKLDQCGQLGMTDIINTISIADQALNQTQLYRPQNGRGRNGTGRRSFSTGNRSTDGGDDTKKKDDASAKKAKTPEPTKNK